MIVDKDVVDPIPKNPPQCENILPNFLKEGGGGVDRISIVKGGLLGKRGRPFLGGVATFT